jgi:hypothetical protein
MKPWDHRLPPALYKYLPAERLHVLSDCRVRFTQRIFFEDDHELQPDYAIFGTESEIWRYALSEGLQLSGGLPAHVIIAALARSPRAQKIAIENLQKNIPARDEMGILCLTDTADCDQMWAEYAGDGTGFVIGFDTGHAAFELLKTPGRLGKVSYSDTPIGSALGSLWNDEAIGALFRKRMKYAFEREWRSLRMLKRLERCSIPDVFLSPFDAASVREIIIRPNCAVQAALEQLVATDPRYEHITMVRAPGHH